MNIRTLLPLFLLCLCGGPAMAQQEIDLSGTWEFETDLMDFRRASVEIRGDGHLHETIQLPGITDDYGIGHRTSYKYYDRLTRKCEYMGPAWYRKYIDVPAEWEGKRIYLYLERAHWLTSIYRGRNEVNRCDYVSVPHVHDLTGYLKPGQTDILDLMIDNRFQYNTHKWDHAHTEYTQINWNGAIGEVKLVARDSVFIDDLQVYPDVAHKSIRAELQLQNTTGHAVKGEATFIVEGNGLRVEHRIPVHSADSLISLSAQLALGSKARLWDEFTPNLYTLDCRLQTEATTPATDSRQVTFGLREVRSEGNDILLNGHRIHLRGTVNNAEFPLTGHVPMDDASWERLFTILKDYGMNHMRFHSWCPPAACFRMADKMGVYLEVEMPMWGADGKPGDERRNDFFRRELQAILKEYGNHPSFLLYCNGNELEGDFGFLEELTHYGRETDPRRLYSGSTARRHVPSEQFYISHRSDKGGVTIYEGRPYTDWDINAGHGTGQPIISHETGQRCVYPNFDDISRYTGPVEARNLEVYRDSLAAHGMLEQARDFYRVTGQQTRVEYKDVIEGQLRTSLSSGFQLLSLVDFPGQGYAPVGILDAFLESKGILKPEEFRRFCAPTVPLLRFKKRSYYNDEMFTAKAEIYHYGPEPLRKPSVRWEVTDASGQTLYKGRLRSLTVPNYAVTPVDSFSFSLEKVPANTRLTVRLMVGNQLANEWDIWVYARRQAKDLLASDDQVLYASRYTEQVKSALRKGKTVVLLPQPKAINGRRSYFHNHFWNPIMFKWAPLTLGSLIHNGHEAFREFVTEDHLDWQWWDILSYAKVMEMDNAPKELQLFIQPIDTYQHNHKLGIGFEARMYNGKLLVLALDVTTDWDKRPATQQLLHSIRSYVTSSRFQPQVVLDESFLTSLYSDAKQTEEQYEQDDFLNSFHNK